MTMQTIQTIHATPHPQGQPHQTDPTIDPTNHITTSTPCRNCGYDLMTQPLDGQCPECGMGVPHAAGLVHVDLDHPTPREAKWLAGLRRSTRLLFIGTLLTPFTAGIAALPAYVGMMGLCRPRPDQPEPTRDRQARRFAQTLLSIGMAGMVVGSLPVFAMLVEHGYRALYMDLWSPLDGLLAYAATFFVFGLFPLFVVVRNQARLLGERAQRLDAATAGIRRWWIAVPSFIVLLAVLAQFDPQSALHAYIPRGWHSAGLVAPGLLLIATLLALTLLWLASLWYAWRLWRGIAKP